MANTENESIKHSPVIRDEVTPMPEVNTLAFADVMACFKHGLSDFRKAPSFGLFIGGIFTIGGLIIIQALFVWKQSWMIYPVMIGFPLIAPFAAVALYDVSRRLDKNLPLNWNQILSVIWVQSGLELRWMAFVILFISWISMYQVRLLLALFLGNTAFSNWQGLFEIITTTPQGWLFIIVGHIVGGFLAMVLFSVSVISLPLLLERDADFITAMITSVKTVFQSPFVMISFGIFVLLAILVAFIPAFLGLLLVLPVLGHTTWHIYKKAVV